MLRTVLLAVWVTAHDENCTIGCLSHSTLWKLHSRQSESQHIMKTTLTTVWVTAHYENYTHDRANYEKYTHDCVCPARSSRSLAAASCIRIHQSISVYPCTAQHSTRVYTRHSTRVCTWLSMSMYIYIYALTYMHTCIFTYNMSKNKRMYMSKHTHIYIYIYIYI